MEAGIVLPPSPEIESLETIFPHVTLRRGAELIVQHRLRKYRNKLINRTWFPGLVFTLFLLATHQASAAGSPAVGVVPFLGDGPDRVMVTDSSQQALAYHIDVGGGTNTVAITDNGGDDTYTITGSASSLITIKDGPGADTYEFIGVPLGQVFFLNNQGGEADLETVIDDGNIVVFE